MTRRKTKQRNRSNTPSKNNNHLTQQAQHGVSKSQQVTTEVAYAGPIPPASELAYYDEVLPGSAERILKMAEENMKHDHNIRSRGLSAHRWEVHVGQIFALIITLAAFGTCIYLAQIGHPNIAGIIGGTTVVGLATAFIYGRKKQK